MSASVAIASVAAPMVAKAHDEACKVTIQTYEAHTATVEQMRDYASCVNRLHPSEMTGGEVIALKIIIVLVLTGAVIGCIKPPFAHGQPDLEDRVMGFVVGAIATACGLLVIGPICAAIEFLFR